MSDDLFIEDQEADEEESPRMTPEVMKILNTEQAVGEQRVMNPGRVGKLGVIHLNGNVMCAVEICVSGPLPRFHDLIQICVLPLNANLVHMKEIIPFYCDIQPKRPEHCSEEFTKVSRNQITHSMINGLDPWRAVDLFEEWMQKLKLSTGKKISPLSRKWPTDCQFIEEWMGTESYNQFFDTRYRDTQVAALFMNDRSDIHIETAPYARVSLRALANRLKVEYEKTSDCLQNCVAIAECYKKMLRS